MGIRKVVPVVFAAVGLGAIAWVALPFDSDARSPAVAVGAIDGDDWEVDVLSPTDSLGLEPPMARAEYDLRKADDRQSLRQAIGRLAALGERQAAHETQHPERYLPFEHDVSSTGKRRALAETLTLLDQLKAGVTDSAPVLRLLELIHAVQNSFRYPVVRTYQVIPGILPGLLLQIGRHQTVDTRSSGEPVGDPLPSSFWRDPGDVRSGDLHSGFRRAAIPRYDGEVCDYLGPKTGWGAHPGFDIRCGVQELTFKLGDERYGAPFNSRVFDALGYYTVPIDPVEQLRLRYTRRVLVEYNSRKLLQMHAKVGFLRVKTRTITDIEDPFARIDHAVMRDGQRIPSAELKRRLLRNPEVVKGQPRPETIAGNYDPELEQRIDYLVWEPGTAELESINLRTIGAWDYDQLDHAARREVRALFVLAAWVDQFNLRWENTRLAYLNEGGKWSLVHLLSDVGSGLGLAKDIRHSRNSDVDTMLWEVTERDADGIVRFSGFASSMENKAFAAVTAADARWILRRMAGLSESQILAALVATGMTAAEVRLALEKLVSKRRKMIEDFGLAGEFPEIISRTVNRTLDFDPRNPADLAQVTHQTRTGARVPPIGILWVKSGRLEKRP